MKKTEAGTAGFDDRLEKLEKLAEEMRSQDLGIERAMAVFEEGIALAKSLEKDLGKIESRVEVLLNDPKTKSETPEIGLFDQD